MSISNSHLVRKAEQAESAAIQQVGNIGNLRYEKDPSPLPESAESWGPLLKSAGRTEKKGIIARGRLFHAAKSGLSHGEWSRIWKLKKKSDRPTITKRQGDKYALVGQEFGEANENWGSHLAEQLPGSLKALHYLAQMGRQLVLELIADGTIHEGLTEGKALELRNQYRPDLKKERPFELDRWLARFDKLIGLLEDEGAPQELEAAAKHIEGGLEALQKLSTAKYANDAKVAPEPKSPLAYLAGLEFNCGLTRMNTDM